MSATGPAAWFDLRADQASGAEIDARLRGGVAFTGTNIWVLVCATFVASVGLNVNSAAVIIGAMLISPLMGPIMGIGYAAAVQDLSLMQASARNLGLAVVFSLSASTAWFLLTPWAEAGSELLARTSPTIWDVVIALFGGLAGAVGVTRKERGNVVPGVAIATALMPPLCTAGFGIATRQPAFVVGALYLFVINSVSIAAATFVVLHQLDLPDVAFTSPATRVRARQWIAALMLVTAIPSVVLAQGLVQQELFERRADRFVDASFPVGSGVVVVDRDVDPSARRIRLSLVGPALDADRRARLDHALDAHGLAGATLDVIEVERAQVDVAALRDEVAGEVLRGALAAVQEVQAKMEALEASFTAPAPRTATLAAEMIAAWPLIREVVAGEALATSLGGDPRPVLVVVAVAEGVVDDETRARVRGWLQERHPGAEVRLEWASEAARVVDGTPG